MNRPARFLVLVALCLTFTGTVLAKHSDRFIFGTYSYLKNSFPYFVQYRDSLCSSMEKLGYNSSVIETFGQDEQLGDLLATLDKHGMDAWITDRGWSNDPSSPLRYAVTPLSTSAYYRLEAEFGSEKPVLKGDDRENMFWYAFRDDNRMQRHGNILANKNASHGYVFQAQQNKDKPGYLLTDLRNRWPNANGFYIRVGEEFHIYQKNPPSHANDYMWITFRVRVSKVKSGLKADDPLFKVQVAGFERTLEGFGSEEKLVNQKRFDKPQQETLYKYSDYQVQKNNDGFFDLQIKVAYADLIAAKLLTADLDENPATPPSAYLMKVANLNPRLYWFGNCDLEVDYVDIEDQIHHELTSDPEFWSKGISQRLASLVSKGKGNVSGFYLFDEPYQGNFDSYRILQDILNKNGLRQFTATYDYQYGKVYQDKSTGKSYDHLAAFMNTVHPRVMAPDIYPIKPSMQYNPGKTSEEQEWFLQNVLDRKLLPVYDASKKYCQQDKDRIFMPIVQVFGHWGGKQWVINACPPPATQKALLYLPLCYGPDGIFQYRMHSFPAADGSGEYTALCSNPSGNTYLPPQKNETVWKLLVDNNPRIKQYGEIIRGLSWEGADRIMLTNLNNKHLRKLAKIKKIKVKTQHDGLYEGYVQMGVYRDAAKNPWLMVVNRRTNYFDKSKYQNYSIVPPAELGIACPEAKPQILEITLGFKDKVLRGSQVALYDPVTKTAYTAHKGKIEVPLAAGEGKLLQLLKGEQAKNLRSGK